MSELIAIEKSVLTGIGDAIRARKDTSDLVPVPNIANEITGFPTVRIDGEKVTRDYNLVMSEIWESVSNMPVTMGPNFRAIVYKNRIHIIGYSSDVDYHYAFDGTQWVELATFTQACMFGDPIIHNGELYVPDYWGMNKWNDDGSITNVTRRPWYEVTYSGEEYTGYHGNYFTFFQDEIHMFAGAYYGNSLRTDCSHKKYNASTGKWEDVNTLPTSAHGSDAFFEINGELHWLEVAGAGAGGHHYKFDGVDTWTYLGNPPIFGERTKILMLDGVAHLYAQTTGSRAHWIFDGVKWTQLEDLGCDLAYSGRMVEFRNVMHYLGVGTVDSSAHQACIETYREG